MEAKQLKIIAFVGMPGSGKGTCTDYLHEKYGWPIVHFGHMFYEEMQRRGLDNVKDENWFRPKLREEQGPDVLAKLAAAKAEALAKDDQTRIVFDGLYTWGEYTYLRQKFGDSLLVIAVTAPRQERYRRILSRHDEHRKYTSAEQIQAREITEIEEIDKGGPIAIADYTLTNDTEPTHMTTRLDAILAETKLV